MRYRKKIEKDEGYVNTALKLCSVTKLISNLTDEKTPFSKNNLCYFDIVFGKLNMKYLILILIEDHGELYQAKQRH